jgi:hypothetical protein
VRFPNGAVAQLGERLTGSQEVRGSIPLGSTKNQPLGWFFCVPRGIGAKLKQRERCSSFGDLSRLLSDVVRLLARIENLFEY